ncbi:MAG: putative Na+/H+ antiporter [Burkholderiales bacterium]|nr:putative Na+/H+ antiporter [Burkholderiales bacterium]MDE2453290.1 putative Na+/H+ antiporter [Burkholderiales bacterium]
MPAFTTLQLLAAVLFALAVLHTFCTRFFERLAHRQPKHAGAWHLLGEVEVVFGFWALLLMVCMFALSGSAEATKYLDTRNFTEPMFVFAVMVIAGTRPILLLAGRLVALATRALPLPGALASYVLVLIIVPLLGSFITEPAAMTLAALMLRDLLFDKAVSARLKYATLGVLFVNVSIGGTLTHFAAPPVLMVASTWNWDFAFMLTHFGWRSATAVAVNAVGAALLFRREIVAQGAAAKTGESVPFLVTLTHLGFLAGVVVFAHHPPIFMGLLLFFLGFATAYERHQNPLILREALLVAFFLAGLVVLGGLQSWWLEPLLLGMSPKAVYYGATALTAITDNAALTYLASLVPGLDPEFKVAIVAGAVTGGGLTVIANAPNPAGLAILRNHFDDQTVHPLGLLAGALAPTLVAIAAFRLL